MKPRVAILYSGEMRSNSLNPNYINDTIILDATTKYLLNDEFKNKYDFDVFICADNIDLKKATIFFGKANLKNIYLDTKNWYLNQIETNIPSYEHFYDNYCKIDFKNCMSHKRNTISQFYKLYSAYNLMLNYQKKHGVKYDYLIRIRPDSRIMQNIMPLFNILETSNKKIIAEHDQFFILKYEYQDIFKLVEYCGTYNEDVNLKSNLYMYLMQHGNLYSNDILCFAPEKQFVDHVYYTVKNKGGDFNETFLGLTYPSVTVLYRENGKYGYINDSHPIYKDSNCKWTPIHDVNRI